MGTLDEAAMVADVLGGDPEAFARLFARFRPLVFSAAFRITGDADVAEDVVQETFLKIHGALRGFRPEARLSTWIYRIAVNAALDERRRAKRRPVTESRHDGPLPEPAWIAPEAGAGDRIREAVAALPPRRRRYSC
ncbi:MAG: RNA polymerase sigma-70 factor ECF [Planctomycetota bacterium]|nr:MAG: RNA polymerase sigma-70 factor ECF [Planctomycetota bacterium]